MSSISGFINFQNKEPYMMKRIIVIALLTLVVMTSAQPATETNGYCDTADETCTGLWVDVFQNCMEDDPNASYEECNCRAWRSYNTCMGQFGCSGMSEQFMVERGCGIQ